jgi:hypothetical protein
LRSSGLKYAAALMLSACASVAGESSSHERTETVPEAPIAPPAGCEGLPAERPVELSIVVSRHVLPHGQAARREVGELVTDASRCTEESAHCRVASPAVLDSLYESIRRGELHRFRTRAAQRGPHYGSRFITITWPDGRCEVGESSSHALEEDAQRAFSGLFDEITVAYAHTPARE